MMVYSKMKEFAGKEYVFEVTALSRYGVAFLDTYISKDDSGKVSWTPYSKPGQIKIPLGPSSSHSPNVHASWPVAELHRLRRRSSCYSAFLEAKKQKMMQFAEEGIIIKTEVDFTAVQRKSSQKKPNQMWLKLPFHPLYLPQLFETY